MALLPLALLLAAALPLAAPGSESAQAQPGSAQDARTSHSSPDLAAGYYQFMLGRHLQSSGKLDEAVAALQEAARLVPGSAEVLAELAGVYAEQDRAKDALEMAERALALDPATVSAHRVLGSIYAALAFAEHARPGQGGRFTAKAIEHLEAVDKALGIMGDPNIRVALARLYLSNDAPEKAIGVLSVLRREEPGALELAALLAQAYTNAGRHLDAVNVLEEANRAGASFDAPIGELYERLERWREAANAYARGVERNPDNLDLKTSWAFALLNADDRASVERSRALLTEVLNERPGDDRALYLLANAQRVLGDLDAAEATARKLVSSDSDVGYLALAQILQQRRDYRKVVETLQPVVARMLAEEGGGRQGADPTPLILHLAYAAQELGEFDRAIALLEQAKRRQPSDVSIDVDLVHAYLAAGRAGDAVARAAAALDTNPADPRLVRAQAEALREDGKAARGIDLLRESLAANGPDVQTSVALADLLTTAERYGEAVTVLEEAQKVFPDEVVVPFQLGAVYERQQRFDAAEQAFRRVLARDPLHAPALNYLGYMLAERGERLKESVELIRRALAVDPQNPSYLDSLGWAYYKLNELELAESTLRKAAGQMPRSSVIQAHYGDVLARRGRRSDAIAAWKRALEGDGESIVRSEIEAKIRSAEGRDGRK